MIASRKSPFPDSALEGTEEFYTRAAVVSASWGNIDAAVGRLPRARVRCARRMPGLGRRRPRAALDRHQGARAEALRCGRLGYPGPRPARDDRQLRAARGPGRPGRRDAVRNLLSRPGNGLAPARRAARAG